jgi:hypothetical protein
MYKKLLLSALFLIVLLLLILPGGQFLIIKEQNGKALISQPVNAGDVIHYRYIHSVELVPVTDTFLVLGDGMLLLKNTTFSSSGYGLPTDSSYNLTMTETGEYLIENINKSMDHMSFQTYGPAQCHIDINGNDYPVYTMVEDGTPLVMDIEVKPYVTGLLGL